MSQENKVTVWNIGARLFPNRENVGIDRCMKYLAAVILATTLLIGQNACAADEHGGVFDDLDKGLIEDYPNAEDDNRLSRRALYSVHFDNWMKHYMDGNDAAAEKDWAGILKEAKGLKSLRTLMRAANSRIQFLEGKDQERCLKRGDLIFADNLMLKASEKALGQNNVLVATGYEYMSNCYGDIYKWDKYIEYQLKSLKIRDAALGPDNPDVAVDLKITVKKLYKLGRYKECLPLAERMVKLGTKYGEVEYTKQGKSYVNLVKRKLAAASATPSTTAKKPTASQASMPD